MRYTQDYFYYDVTNKYENMIESFECDSIYLLIMEILRCLMI